MSHMRLVIEKELLHYDIIFALSQAGLLPDLVFQEGACLRLFYGSNRFSEDLNFAGDCNSSSQRLLEIKDAVESHLGSRYGLIVSVNSQAR